VAESFAYDVRKEEIMEWAAKYCWWAAVTSDPPIPPLDARCSIYPVDEARDSLL